MFVRVKKIGAYEYLYLVENAREGGRHVQRVIKALGRRDEVEASGLIDGLIASAAMASIVDNSVPGAAQAEAWIKANVYQPLVANGTFASDPSWAIIPRTDTNVLPAQPTATP